MTTNKELFAAAQRVMPGGVNSPVRSFRSVGGTPYFVNNADGPYVWDVEGTRYIDYVMSYGPGIAGHANPVIVDAVTTAAADGLTFGAPTAREVEMADAICERVDGLEMVRLVSSGTEATMSALRLARGVTKRAAVVKFAGHYHGHSDSLLAAGGSGVANQGLADSAGVTAGQVADTIVAPWNVVPELDEKVACVIVEPVAANMGLVPPADGFLQALRNECDRVGALLIFDEVITGFRLARGGASSYFGVTPDIWCFGKVIGGGLPVGCYGASQALMSHIAPLGDVYQAGTLSGNPLATAAGLAQLSLLDDEAYQRLEATAIRLAAGMTAALRAEGIPVVMPQIGSLLGIYFTETAPTNFDEANEAATNGWYRKFFHASLDRGIAFAPGPYEAVFVSLAHDDSVIDATIDAVADAAAELAADPPRD